MKKFNDFTVFIVDDDTAVRHSLMLMLKQQTINVQLFESAEQFLESNLPYQKGCIITDLQMPGMDGLQLQEVLGRKECTLPIIFLTGHGTIPHSVKAIKAGAVDFLTKPVTRKKLLACITSAFDECEKLLEAENSARRARSLLTKLTGREREVLAFVVQGLSNKEIAAHLGISHRTVEIHRSNVMQKTGAMHLLELKKIAQESNQHKLPH
ncbi:MAG: response regulator transcription factor [Nitrosomonas sp.]|nr:response regulator transcription factor [Nitrosomonas sp.]